MIFVLILAQTAYQYKHLLYCTTALHKIKRCNPRFFGLTHKPYLFANLLYYGIISFSVIICALLPVRGYAMSFRHIFSRKSFRNVF